MESYRPEKRTILIAGRLSLPRGANDAAFDSLFRQVARELFGVAVCGETSTRSCFRDCLRQGRPVCMIRQDESPIVPALPSHPADPHQARREAIRDVAETSHPWRAACR